MPKRRLFRVDMAEVVADVADLYSPVFSSKNIDFDLRLPRHPVDMARIELNGDHGLTLDITFSP